MNWICHTYKCMYVCCKQNLFYAWQLAFNRTKKKMCATEFMEILPFYLNMNVLFERKDYETNMWQTSVKHMQLIVLVVIQVEVGVLLQLYLFFFILVFLQTFKHKMKNQLLWSMPKKGKILWTIYIIEYDQMAPICCLSISVFKGLFWI